METRKHLLTEQANPNSLNLDQLSSLEIVALFNQEDTHTISAIAQVQVELAHVIDRSALGLSQGGRLFYIGAGTSGRLGVLDAAECPPTFCTDPTMVQGILAGGAAALLRSSEGLEDIFADGEQAIADRAVGQHDIVIGIAAGGTTPYVHGALAEGRRRGATTVFIACVPIEQVKLDTVDIDVRLLVGPEILAGSTRLKSGTVTKMALNIISTGTMVRLGKVYGNRMIDVAVSNTKLHDRALGILQDLTDLDRPSAEALLVRSDKSVKRALMMHWGKLDRDPAQELLTVHQGDLRQAVASVLKD
jgi:N-acetylmuramic acid 6-phosphate etherase